MSLLISGDVNSISIKNIEVPINTDFRLWLEFFREINKEKSARNDRYLDSLLSKICPHVEDYPDDVLEALLKYFDVSDGNEIDPDIAKLTPSSAHLFDLLKDEHLVIADFQREYHINLLDLDLNMSWRRFKILLDNMSSKSAISSRIGLRDLDLKDVPKKNIAKVKALKAKYALKTESKKLTVKERDAIYKNYIKKRSQDARK